MSTSQQLADEMLAEFQASRGEMTVRDLMSTTHTLLNLPAHELRKEANNIELAHERLSRLLRRIYGD
jgi:hypothetical protein